LTPLASLLIQLMMVLGHSPVIRADMRMNRHEHGEKRRNRWIGRHRCFQHTVLTKQLPPGSDHDKPPVWLHTVETCNPTSGHVDELAGHDILLRPIHSCLVGSLFERATRILIDRNRFQRGVQRVRH
jgi:hypothetical protein